VSKPPVWLLEFTIEPRFAADSERLVRALAKMALEDMTFGYSKHTVSGEIIAKGVDEQCLDKTTDILLRTFNIEVNVGAPRVAYREILARAVEVDYTHKSPAGGTGQFARVKLRLEPSEGGNEFQSEIVGNVVPNEYIPGVEKGVRSVWDSGVLIGSPMVDMKVTLYDGAYHHEDSSAIAYEVAARQAMREGCKNAGVKLHEPIMDVEVVTPGEFVGTVIKDLNTRRGQIFSQKVLGVATVIRAHVPFANLFGYRNTLNSITNGLASYAMRFSHYAEPPNGNGPDDFRPAVGMRA
jgi:elongation factor G